MTATVAANGSVYAVGVLVHYEQSEGDPESGPVSTGSTAFVAKWNPTTQRLLWLVQMGSRFRDEGTPAALVVQDSIVYVLGQFDAASQGFGHPVRATGRGDVFVTRLTDHGTHATANWTQPLGYPNRYTWARHLACDGAAVYVAGTTEEVESRLDPATSQWLPRASRAFVAKLTDAGTRALPGWQHTWDVRRGYHEVVALATQRGRVYLATNTWQPTPSPSEPQGWRGEGMLPAHANYRVHLTQFRSQGAGYRIGWTHTEAGQGAGLALAGNALYVTGRADADHAFGHPPADAQDVPGDLFVAKLVVTGTTVQTAWVQRLRGTGHDEYARMPYVAVRGRRVYLAGIFALPRLALDSVVLRNSNRNSGNRNLFVAQLTDAGATSRFDWAHRLGNEHAADFGAFALDGPRLYISGYFQGYRNLPVLLGKQQFLVPYENVGDGVLLQGWLPVGP
ncbi:hypothetical protein Q5H92_13695 [Hymenobacter sp. M29]|uniref:Uncharacterized protein n=1 Tax=Hymenobacter mellowenesis TaxID=3063995 RepID=A0ABT9AC42_9BACT|nr:hypothetical protein [Hymenobacter sp. M29]